MKNRPYVRTTRKFKKKKTKVDDKRRVALLFESINDFFTQPGCNCRRNCFKNVTILNGREDWDIVSAVRADLWQYDSEYKRSQRLLTILQPAYDVKQNKYTYKIAKKGSVPPGVLQCSLYFSKEITTLA